MRMARGKCVAPPPPDMVGQVVRGGRGSVWGPSPPPCAVAYHRRVGVRGAERSSILASAENPGDLAQL